MKPTTVMTIKGAKSCLKADAILGRTTAKQAAKTILVLMDLLQVKCECWRTAGECSNCQKKQQIIEAMKQDKLSQVVMPMPYIPLDQGTLDYMVRLQGRDINDGIHS